MPSPLDASAPLDDTSMPSDESSIFDSKIHVSDLPLTSDTSTTNILSNLIITPTTLDLQVGNQDRRYSL